MLPHWFIEAKKAGESAEQLRKRVEEFCRESDRAFGLPEKTPDPMWVKMMMVQFEAYYEELERGNT